MAFNPFSLEGKTVLVTGASSGIGRAVAIACSKMGARVVLTGRNEKRLNETKDLMEKELTHEVMVADLSNGSQVAGMVDSLPLLDGVVYSAGIGKFMPISFLQEKLLNDLFGVNCFSSMLLTKYLIKKRKLSNPSSMVYIASIAGVMNVSPANSVYGASKSALNAFVKYAALELAGRGVRCNSVLPGRVETPLIEHSQMTEEDVERDKERYPMKRYGKPEEVANAVLYLLSDASSWVTGTQLVIDGGRSLV